MGEHDMKSHQICLIGVILFFLGLPLLILSWYNSYPIHIGSLDELTFTQFSPLIWPGIFLTSTGLFVAGYFSTRNSVKAICASIFPISLYSYVFYFNGTATSDIGNVKSMFDVFHFTGIDSSVIPYFQFPTYFTFNEVTARITGMDSNSIGMIFFALFGVLLGLYLYLFLFKVTKSTGNQVALVGVFIYFSISFSFLNYQWVPQTLALIFLFLLLSLVTLEGRKYKILMLVIFVVLVFTHLFIPLLFLLFFGMYSLKKRETFRMFIVMTCLYAAVLVYLSSYYLPQIFSAFMEMVYGFGEYSNTLSQSLKLPTTSFFDQLISNINRVRVPITIGVLALGFLISLYKRKIHYILLVLGLAGSVYLLLGLVYPVLGWRALQILIVALVAGIGFFIKPSRMKKPAVALVFILIALSIRGSYDQTQYILNEEENTCRFLASSVSSEKTSLIGVDQVNWGYFTNIAAYITKGHTQKIRPSSVVFYDIFNSSMKNNHYVIYNSNVGKEIRENGIIPDYRQSILETVLLNNKVYSCGRTYIITG
jgi:hypothetical protein